jgi:hypothetical protein
VLRHGGASKFAFARLMLKATIVMARAFIDELIEAVPYRIHSVLTDNGMIDGVAQAVEREGPSFRARLDQCRGWGCWRR